MEAEIIRIKSTPFSLSGKLAFDGVFKCYTLERPYTDFDFKPIPEGKYPLVMRPSAKFGRLMPHIENVPGRTGIEIHCGNHVSDSEGCILIGMQLGDDALWGSRIAFDLIFPILMDQKEPVFITVKENLLDGTKTVVSV